MRVNFPCLLWSQDLEKVREESKSPVFAIRVYVHNPHINGGANSNIPHTITGFIVF
jgi:hypothetical protein